MNRRINWDWQTPKQILEKHVLKLKPNDELVITGFYKPTGGGPFGETVEDNKTNLVFTASRVMNELVSNDNLYKHEIDTENYTYTIRRIK